MNFLKISVLFLSVFTAKSYTVDPESLQKIDASLSEVTKKKPVTTTELPSFLDFFSQIEDLPIFNKYQKIDSHELEVPNNADIEIDVPLVGAQFGRVAEHVPRQINQEANEAFVELEEANDNTNAAMPDSVEDQTFFNTSPAISTTASPSTTHSTTVKHEFREAESAPTIPTIVKEKVEKNSAIEKIPKPTEVFGKLKEDLKMKVLLLKSKNKALTENKIRSLLVESPKETTTNLPATTTTDPTTLSTLLEAKSPLEKFKNLLNIKFLLKNESNDNDDCAKKCNECRKSKTSLKESLQKEDSLSNNAVENLNGNSLAEENFSGNDDTADKNTQSRPITVFAPKTRNSRGTGDTNYLSPAPLIPQAPALTNLFPAIQKPQFLERLETESSVERSERFNDGLQRLMHFVTIMAQVDSFITSRARSTVKKLAHLYGQDEYPLGYNLRTKNPNPSDSFT